MHKRHPVRNGHLLLVTANTRRRSPIFEDPACAREAVESLYRIRYWNPFLLFAFVVMPDHCHLLLSLPKHDSVSRFVETYKQAVEFELRASAWEPQFHLEIVQACGRVKDYVQEDPVRQNLCTSPADYPWSSASGRWEVSEMPSVQQTTPAASSYFSPQRKAMAFRSD